MLAIANNVDEIIENVKIDFMQGGGLKVDPKNEDNAFEIAINTIHLEDYYGLMKADAYTFENLSPVEMQFIEYMKNEEIGLYIIPDDRSEMFSCTPSGFKAIYLCPKNIECKNNERVCAWSHELGHYLDLKYGFNFDVKAMTKECETELGLVKCEVIAWAYAKIILEELGYDEWTDFANEAVKALNTYIWGGTKCTMEHMRKSGEYIASRFKKGE